MADWLKRLGLVVAAFGVVWVVAIAIWRKTTQSPDTAEIAFYLLGLPIVLLLSAWAGFALVRRLRSSPDAPPATPEQDPAESDSLRRENEERSWSVNIAGSAIRCVHGATWEELAEKLDSGRTELTLDEHLTDADAFPILTGRVALLDKSGEIDKLDQWLGAHGGAEITWSKEDRRALALGGSAVRELAERIVAHPLLQEYLASTPAKRATVALPALQLVACLPPWQDDQHKLALTWFSLMLEQQGWPAEKIVISPLAAGQHAHPMQWIDRLCLTTGRQALPCFALLVTCMSDIGEETVSKWAAEKRLLTAQNKHGAIPGEGAAALLITDAQLMAVLDESSATVIHRVAKTQRDKPIDESRRVTAELLSMLADDSMAVAEIKPADIGALVSDNHRNANRTTEMMVTGAELLPDLDPTKSYAAAGALCATTGAVSTALALSFAHHKCLTDRVCTLCVSNQDATEVLAVVVKPVDAAASRQH